VKDGDRILKMKSSNREEFGEKKSKKMVQIIHKYPKNRLKLE